MASPPPDQTLAIILQFSVNHLSVRAQGGWVLSERQMWEMLTQSLTSGFEHSPFRVTSSFIQKVSYGRFQSPNSAEHRAASIQANINDLAT